MKEGNLVKRGDAVGILVDFVSYGIQDPTPWIVAGIGWLSVADAECNEFPYPDCTVECVGPSNVTLCTYAEANAFKARYPKAKFNMPEGKKK